MTTATTTRTFNATIVNSTAIASVGYDQESSTMRIAFRNDRVYDYQVTSSTFSTLAQATSIGQYFNQAIRNEYEATELNLFDAEAYRQAIDDVMMENILNIRFVVSVWDFDTIVVNSTAISAIAYNPPTQTMRIIFGSGAAYDYFNVSNETFSQLICAESVGRQFALIRSTYTEEGEEYIRLDNQAARRFQEQAEAAREQAIREAAISLNGATFIVTVAA